MHCDFTAKGNQQSLPEDVTAWFDTAAPPDFEEKAALSHGRIEQRAIWTTTELNAHVRFPGIGQVFMLRRSREYNRRAQHRDRLRGNEPHPRHRARAAAPAPQPRPLVHREAPSSFAEGG